MLQRIRQGVMNLAKAAQFKSEWLYSENDLSQIFNKPITAIRQMIQKNKLKLDIRYMLNRRLVTGKSMNALLNNVNLDEYHEQKKLNFVDNSEYYTRHDAIEAIGVSMFKFNEQYIKQYGLTATSKDTELGLTYFRGSDINQITQQIQKDSRITVYPDMVSDDLKYHQKDLFKSLNISYGSFKRIYLDMYHLQPVEQEQQKGQRAQINYYQGRDVNRITQLIREDYFE